MASNRGSRLDARLAAAERRKEAEYWRQTLAGDWIPARFPRDGGPGGSPQSESIHPFGFDPFLAERTVAFCGGSDIAVHVFLTAALHALAGLLDREEATDKMIIAPIVRQESDASFINTVIPVRCRFDRNTPFKELLLAARDAVADGDAYQNFPLLEIFPAIRETGIAVLLEQIHDPRQLESLRPDMVWSFRREGDNLSGRVSYQGALYRPETVKRLALRLESLVRQILSEVERPLGRLEIWLPGEKEELLEAFDNSGHSYPLDARLDELFSRQAERVPSAVAIRAKEGNLQLSYDRLNLSSLELAGYLQSRGIGPGQLVGITSEPSVDAVLAVLGILRAGAAYVPFAPSLAPLRREYMMRDCRPSLVLDEGDIADRRNSVCGGRAHHRPDDPAYVIYTSGSTGKPKGVVVEHRGAVNYVSWACEVYLDGDSCAFPLFTPLAFDLTVTSLFVPLVSGNSVITMAGGDPAETLRFIFQHPLIHAVKLTPSHVNMALELEPFRSAVRRLIVGGEELTVDLASAVWNHFARTIDIFNEYGPTETVVGCMIHRFDPMYGGVSVPIGYPSGNSRCYILDEAGNLLPPAALGELCIGGKGVARGYLNHPEMTARFFLPDPFHPGARMYKSGDLARYTVDGPMEFAGRLDSQVKIRGFRVELGEVEAALRQHPSVKEAVVAVRPAERGEGVLCAYLVMSPEDGPGDAPLRELPGFLAQRLPEQMLPARYIQLDSIPLTVNGKVDTRALPDPQERGEDEVIPPRHGVDRQLRKIWSEVLGLSQDAIGIDQNYFRLGGHSLSAVSLLARIHRQFGVKIPLAEFFRIPHIRGLADYIPAAEDVCFDPVAPVEKRDYYELSSAQKRIFILQYLDPRGTGYNTPLVAELTGELDEDRLERAFVSLIARHESFRSSFFLLANQPAQRVHGEVPFAVGRHDATRWDDAGPDRVKREIERFIAPFDLAAAPLLRAMLVRCEAGRHVLVLDMHHIVVDGVSMNILIRDFMDLYAGKALPPLDVQYRDYALWQREQRVAGRFESQERYWVQRFSDSIPLLDLPADFPRPDILSEAGRLEEFTLEPGLTAQVKALAEERGATLFMTLLAVFNVLLARLSGQEDIVVGTPVAGRPHVDLEGIIGVFINTLALRNFPAPDLGFVDFLRELKQHTIAAFDNQDYSFEDLVDRLAVRRDTGRNPLFDVMLVLQNMEIQEAEIPGLTLSPYGYEHRRAKIDLIFNGEEAGGEIRFVAEYATDLYRRATILRFIDYFKRLLAQICADPSRKTGEYPLVSVEEQDEILRVFNGNRSDIFGFPASELHLTIQEAFRRRAEKDGDAPAVVFGDVTLTYGELYSRGSRLARILSERGAGPEAIVAVAAGRSEVLVVALLGILSSGAAYLPIDPNYPRERREFMLRDSAACVSLVSGPVGEPMETIIDLNAALEISKGASPYHDAGGPTDAAFVIYTSGTTGKPKGVMVEHRQALNVLSWFGKAYGIGPGSRVPLLTEYTFDPSVNQIFATLSWGGTLHVIAGGVLIHKELLRQYFASRHIQLANQAPSFLKEFLDRQPKLPSLRTVISGGDRLDTDLKDRWLDAGYVVFNHYGPTETGIDACALRCGSGVVTIGAPISNATVVVLGPCGTLQPVGAAGELCISGGGVARGYLNRPELTQTLFVPHPHFDGAIMYKSGDCGRFLEDGSLQLLGRIDQQVKIRGFRVETEEIRILLKNHPSVTDAAVVDVVLGQGEAHLAAFLVTTDEDTDWADYLAERLPYYMVPSRFIAIDGIPVTANGKVDRGRLRRMAAAETTVADFIPPQDALERQVEEIWSKVLGITGIGVLDNFFDRGGNSLLILRVNARLKEVMKRDIPVVAMFKHPTIRSLARYLREEAAAVGEVAPVPAFVPVVDPGRSPDAAVIGMAGRFPGAPDIGTFWDNLVTGVESVVFFGKQELADEGIDAQSLDHPDYVRAAAILENKHYFDAAFFDYSPNEALIMDPQIRIFHECAWAALEDAGYCPDHYEGRIGVYAGAADNFYWQGLAFLSGHGETLGPFAVAQLSNKDYLCARVAYKLNLRGPAMVLHSACSTSLVAIHTAYRAVLAGECDMALAGGVTLAAALKYGYIYQEGMVNSPDGHCRAFDKDARGTVSGEGAGVVVLKPLGAARADRDHVYAVIKGSSANNDGVRRVGFSAPSVEGQAEAIAGALAMAGVDPGTVGYVETHGTGTVLGDPIEVEGLKLAFRTAGTGFCRIGSVKTNIGHLDVAAGVAGFIKTVLALEHRVIPPSLHFKIPNPNIDFDRSPFVVNDAPFLWRPAETPRRAGVSSFGIGGTNAHVILQEAPVADASAVETFRRQTRLLCISARSDAALQQLSSRLAARLQQDPDVDLADVCYTMAVGRRRMACRKMILCRNREEAARLLELDEAPEIRIVRRHRDDGDRPAVFLFSGLGAQYGGMAAGLYRDEPVFRRQVDRCVAVLKPFSDEDVLGMMFSSPPDNGRTESLHDIDGSQLAVFILEYALARLAISWGIRPRAVAGYSFGEYAAASIAGIFEPEDILPVIVTRGRLLKQLPPGGMLSVPLARRDAEVFLHGHLSIAIDNGYSVVIAGPKPEIEAARERFLREKIFTVLLPAPCAMHSAEVEPVLEDFAASLAGVSFKTPDIPVVSNVTGTWLGADQATDPRYWLRHLRQTVQFDSVMKTLTHAGSTVFIEIGPGRDLCNLASRYIEGAKDCSVMASIRQPQKEVSDASFLTRQLGGLWLDGTAIDWGGYYSVEKRSRISLPTYPFEGKKYWIEGNLADLASGLAAGGKTSETRRKLDDWFYIPSWEPSVPGPDSRSLPLDLSCLVFLDGAGVGERCVTDLRRRFAKLATVQPAPEYNFDGNRFYIRPGAGDDYKQLAKDFSAHVGFPALIVHFWGVTGGQADEFDLLDIDGLLRDGFFSLTYLAGALDGIEPELRQGVRIVVVTNGLADITGDEDLLPARAALLGPCRVIPLELPGVCCRCVDIVWPANSGRRQDVFARRLSEEILLDNDDAFVALRGGKRWLQAAKPARLERTVGPAVYVRRNGVYLITGALGDHGGVGFFLARWLARQTKCAIALIGRKELPPEEEWLAYLEAGDEKAVVNRIQKLVELRECGARVMYVAADVADMAQMAAAVRRVEERFGGICGVVHAAAVMGEGTVRFMAEQEADDTVIRQLSPKILGPAILYRLLKDKPLDFCILMSSLASLLGGIGVNAYTAANNVCDAFAHWVSREGDRRWISVNWDNWQNPGRPHEEENPLAMPVEDGVEAFHRILSWGGTAQVIICTVELDQWLEKRRPPRRDKDRKPMGDWFYCPRWRARPLDIQGVAAEAHDRENWLVFAGDGAFDAAFVQMLERSGIEPVIVRAGQTFAALSAREFMVNPAEENDYLALFQSLVRKGRIPGMAAHLWSLGSQGDCWLEPGRMERWLDRSFYSLLYIVRAVGHSGIESPLRLAAVTGNMQPVTGDEALNPHLATVLGPLKIIPLEYSNIACLSIDGDDSLQPEHVRLEMAAASDGFEAAAYRGGVRFAQDYERCAPPEGNKSHSRLKMDGVYLVTGGCGGMASAIARFLVESYRARVILVDIDEPPASGGDAPLGEGLFHYRADVADLERMRRVVREAEAAVGRICGVIHTAGAIDAAGMIQLRSRQDTDDLLRPKISGTMVLDEIFRDRELDFTVLFSSLGNVLYGGKFGQVGYNAGHEFLDVFAAYKYRAGSAIITIDWNDWEGVGMAGRAAERFAPDRRDDVRLSITPAEGLRAFARALELDVPRVVLSVYDLDILAEHINRGKEVLRRELELLDTRSGAGIVEPRPQLDVEFAPPDNEVETQLASIWRDFFAIDRVGIDDDFFELGGDSLKAMTVAAKIQRQLRVKIPLPELFKRSTIRSLSQFIGVAGTDDIVPIPAVEKKDHYVLSAAQKRLYVMQQLDEAGTVYNESTAIIFPHPVAKESLQRVFQQLIQRHESLRTYFVLKEGEPVQRVAEAGACRFAVDEVDNAIFSEKPRTREDLLASFIRPFQLQEAPLLRVALVREDDNRFMMMVDLHHIITDGQSMELLRREFLELYAGNPLPPLRVQYKDYAEWQYAPSQAASAKRQLAYWRELFYHLPQPLRLPYDFPRTGVPGFEGKIVRLELNQDVSALLRRMAAAEDVTLFMLLLAIVYLLLHKISGQEDIVVGTLTAGRPHPDLDAVMGMFVNTLALRHTVHRQHRFVDLLRQVKRLAIDAFGNQDCQFDALVEVLGVPRQSGRNPLFDVMFVLKNQKGGEEGAPATPDPYEFKTQISKFDLIVIGNDNGRQISFTLSYGTHLFESSTIQRISGYLEEAVARVLEAPDIKIADLELSLELQSRHVEVPDMEFGF